MQQDECFFSCINQSGCMTQKGKAIPVHYMKASGGQEV